MGSTPDKRKHLGFIQGVFISQKACKPGSVEIDHLSRPAVASRLERVQIGLAGTNPAFKARTRPIPCSRQGLPLSRVAPGDCELLP